MTKQEQINKLKKDIDSKLFLIEASKLKFKYAKDNAETKAIGLAVVSLSIQVKFLYAQVMIIQAQPIPNYKKGGLSIVGKNKNK